MGMSEGLNIERLEESLLFQEQLAKLERSWAGLHDKPEETPESTLRALWALAAGEALSAERAMERRLSMLDLPQVEALRILVERRLAGEPLGHITRRQSFVGLELIAGPQALIPRKETELLARRAIALTQSIAAEKGSANVLDVCTGSGNLALAVACEVPGSQVTGTDLCQKAVALARKNARFAGVEDRANFLTGDLFEPIRHAGEGPFDLILCNPPYISSPRVDEMDEEIRHFEPKLAFDGGPLGISILWKFIKEAPDFLAPGAALAFEIGLGQAKGVLRRLANSPAFGDPEGLEDVNGDVRAVVAWKR